MSIEEIQKNLVSLEQRINQRVQVLSKKDPKIQRLIGHMEVYKIMAEECVKNGEGGEVSIA